MDFKKFLKVLLRHKWILIIIPIITVGITAYFVKNMPNEYTSQTDIATGLVDASQQISGVNDVQDFKVNQQFSNLMETMSLGIIVNQVSYKLIVHDLTSTTPFTKKSKIESFLEPENRPKALDIFKKKIQNKQALNLNDGFEFYLNKMLVELGYDSKGILKKLIKYRLSNSDFIRVEYTSKNPQQSSFVLNTLNDEFINYVSNNFRQNRKKTNEFLSNLVKQKEDTLKSKVAALRNFKIQNRILDLGDLSGSIYEQITDYKDRKLQAEKDIISYKSALRNINNRFNPTERKYVEASAVKINGQLLQTRKRMDALQDKFIESGFDPKIQRSIDSLQSILTEQILESSDKLISNPLAGKETLVQDKLKLEIDLDMSESSIRNLDNELSRLNKDLDRIVPFQASLQTLERDIEMANTEYQDILTKFNQSGIESSVNTTLRQVEMAVPGIKQPSKKILLVLASGVSSFIICFVVLFLIYFFDKSIKVAHDFTDTTNVGVLGHLNLMKRSTQLDHKRIGSDVQNNEELALFKNLLRSIRFEIDTILYKNKRPDVAVNEGKILAITSINQFEGKSFVAVSLASAYAMANKKVLLIDGNFENPSVSESVQEKIYIEDYLNDDDFIIDVPLTNLVTIIGNRGGDKSLLEKSGEANIYAKMNQLKSHFDIILIETPALSLMNKAKEWLTFSDNILAVFEANQNMTTFMKDQINYLKSLDNRFIGMIMNKVFSYELLTDTTKSNSSKKKKVFNNEV